MLRHVAVFRWLEGTREEQLDVLEGALAGLPGLIPELSDYRFGADAGVVDGNWDFAVVADVEDAAAWKAYIDHPAHQRVLIDLLRPILAERAAIQFEI